MVMLQRLKKNWQELKDQPPGKRFEHRYRRIHPSGGGGGLRKALFIGGGFVVLAVGVFFLPAPGPGLIVVAIGAGLMAQESLMAARVLDRTEVLLRRLASWGLKSWGKASVPVKIALIASLALLVSAAGFGVYQVLIAR
jgi:uncharacterized protein (TIGR02611 family)